MLRDKGEVDRTASSWLSWRSFFFFLLVYFDEMLSNASRHAIRIAKERVLRVSETGRESLKRLTKTAAAVDDVNERAIPVVRFRTVFYVIFFLSFSASQ